MEAIQFEVSAKTARLIGRESISDGNGAIVELIKNAYDADATCVCVMFDMPFPFVPQTISFDLAHKVFGHEMNALLSFYDIDDECYKKKGGLSYYEENELRTLLCTRNRIIVMDNGGGMSESVLRTAWMSIGTDNKEEETVSPGGRVKTGAKGIGRFALDKLSTETQVITKHSSDSALKWMIDWNQFENARLLNEVTATIERLGDYSFEHYIPKEIFDKFHGIHEYSWETGTLIQLSPTREEWPLMIFEKINQGLRTSFPSVKGFRFDVFIANEYYPQYSFSNERFQLSESQYDEKIELIFDGRDDLNVRISRNEIDVKKQKITHKLRNGEEIKLSISDFWNRKAFQIENYHRKDYAREIDFHFSASERLKRDKDDLRSIGPLSAEFYFIKNTPTPNNDLVRPVNRSQRQEILERYSGIKIYRDNFKVRPYGEKDSPGYDWLNLGVRAQQSPNAVSSQGQWRVRVNQVIGEVRISRNDNPLLMDMANREGLANNTEYKIFCAMLVSAIEVFEQDRQYLFREYAQWLRDEEKKVSLTETIISSAERSQKLRESAKKYEEAERDDSEDRAEFRKQEYTQVILELEDERKRQERAMRTMMIYGSAGVLTNTFSHEISHLVSMFGARMQHVRQTMSRAFGEYRGNELLNPYAVIRQSESVDVQLENWLSVLMSGVREEDYNVHAVNIGRLTAHIVQIWLPLLSQKQIGSRVDIEEGTEKLLDFPMMEIDMYIILNNFFLNSIYFLDRIESGERNTTITIRAYKDQIVLLLENNGPVLDREFAHNPNLIFNAGTSTKVVNGRKGSGIGLWITKTVVEDNSGEISVLKKNEGFGYQINLPRRVIEK